MQGRQGTDVRGDGEGQRRAVKVPSKNCGQRAIWRAQSMKWSDRQKTKRRRQLARRNLPEQRPCRFSQQRLRAGTTDSDRYVDLSRLMALFLVDRADARTQDESDSPGNAAPSVTTIESTARCLLFWRPCGSVGRPPSRRDLFVDRFHPQADSGRQVDRQGPRQRKASRPCSTPAVSGKSANPQQPVVRDAYRRYLRYRPPQDRLQGSRRRLSPSKRWRLRSGPRDRGVGRGRLQSRYQFSLSADVPGVAASSEDVSSRIPAQRPADGDRLAFQDRSGRLDGTRSRARPKATAEEVQRSRRTAGERTSTAATAVAGTSSRSARNNALDDTC